MTEDVTAQVERRQCVSGNFALFSCMAIITAPENRMNCPDANVIVVMALMMIAAAYDSLLSVFSRHMRQAKAMDNTEKLATAAIGHSEV